MSWRHPAWVRAALIGAVTLACAIGRPPSAAAAVADSSHAVRVTSQPIESSRLHLERAAMQQLAGDPRGVIEQLEAIDFSDGSFADADRAAFMLAQAYLEVGSTVHLGELARRVEAWHHDSPYSQWIAFQRLLIDSDGAPSPATSDAFPDSGRDASAQAPVGSAAASALAAGLLMRDGDPAAAAGVLDHLPAGADQSALVLHIRSLVQEHLGQDDTGTLRALAVADTVTALGRDLAGGALLRLATRALARDSSAHSEASAAEARSLLARVPAGSRYASRARHMLGVATLEQGDTGGGRQILERLLADDPGYPDRHEVWMALAGQALEHGEWDSAHERYQRIDQDHEQHRTALQRMLASNDVDALWDVWRSDPRGSDALLLDAYPAQQLARQLAGASADLTAPPGVAAPVLGAATSTSNWSLWTVPPPEPAAWGEVAASGQRSTEAADALERARRLLAAERDRLGDRQRYFGGGARRARHEADELASNSALLDSLRRTLAGRDALLRSVRDAEIARVAKRSADILAVVARNELWMSGMQRLYVDGNDHASAAPGGYAGPDSVLRAEQALADSIARLVAAISIDSPGRISRSYQLAWRPGLIDRAAVQDSLARAALVWTGTLSTAIDAGVLASAGSDSLRALKAMVVGLTRVADSTRIADQALRAHVARTAVERALAALDEDREGIDYGLAASAYGLSVRLGSTDSASTRAAPVATAPVADSLATAAGGDELDDPVSARWRAEAITAMHVFLAQHAHSPARAEIRFRLADLLLIDARVAFREQMAEFIRARAEQAASRAALPLLDHGPALELYRQILAEDPDFTHRDAVMFNAGMILADDGEPEAGAFFERLVSEHPQSAYVQESYLRMGDMRFNDKQFQDCVAFYQHAADGPDVGMRVIALYKMGWAHFNEDRFIEAADAFRSVLDVYGSAQRAAIPVDIEGESESYLVHSLAGAGGADVFASYFDRIGPRPYEMRVLMSLGQHFRRYGRLPEAAATDQLCITRFPQQPEALISAQRLIETYQRSERPELEREARLTYATRFAPGSDWSKAQPSDSMRTVGAEFARSSWTTVAFEHHRKARETGSREDWQQALTLYQRLLTTWPEDAGVPSLELQAGEASAQLGDHAGALAHYRASAAGGNDSLASLAMWQLVAVTDAWYESSRGHANASGSALGSDSLAHAVIDAGDSLLKRFPDYPKNADLVWRESQLAFAHGWFDRAIDDLGQMTQRYPTDPRTPVAAQQRGEALFKLGRFDDAGAAFEAALASAERAGRDSLAKRAAAAIPVCYYRQAEAAVVADSNAYQRHAVLFEKVATRWPAYEHADLAEYRAGLAYLRAGHTRDAVHAMQTLIDRFPNSEYVRDAHLQIAKTWDSSGDREQAAMAYSDFAQRYPDDESARAAWLKAGDLLAAAGLDARSDAMRLDYIKHYPDDVESAMTILESLARRELAGIGPERPISTLLPAPSRSKREVAPSSRLAEYLQRGAKHPTLVSRGLLAQVRYLQGEETRSTFLAARLSQPLPKSLPGKQKLLDTLVVRYRRAVDLGVPEWAHASAFRIGQSLVDFGEALEHCERPADLHGDDLLAYEDVLLQKAQVFYDRGEGVWTDLLRQKGAGAPDDAWITQAQSGLWTRLSKRFYYRPEMEFPLVGASSPGRDHTPKDASEHTKASSTHDADSSRALARQQDDDR